MFDRMPAKSEAKSFCVIKIAFGHLLLIWGVGILLLERSVILIVSGIIAIQGGMYFLMASFSALVS
jgi:hypothetical protein